MITRKKIILVLMFLLGSFACLTSIIRLKYLKAFATSTDETVSLFIRCASLPFVFLFVE
jgi:hypothetical protein